MRLLAKFVHGSHLYGLNTESSDTDFKGVYLPSLNDYLLCRVKSSINLSTNKTNQKNDANDVDYEVYSLNKFVEMLVSGEMVAFDMLFAPENFVEYYDSQGNTISSDNKLVEQNPVWQIRNTYSDLFASSDMRAYLGYCKKQAAKYGIKGSRLASLRVLLSQVNYIDTIEGLFFKGKLADVVNDLPIDQYCFVDGDSYVVLGKRHQLTISFSEFRDRVNATLHQYGNRAKLAEQNNGVDWKAVSHAFRAGYQILEMYNTGRMQLPLPKDQRNTILDIKLGKRDWKDVKQELEKLINQVEDKSLNCNLTTTSPDVIDLLVVKLLTEFVK